MVESQRPYCYHPDCLGKMWVFNMPVIYPLEFDTDKELYAHVAENHPEMVQQIEDLRTEMMQQIADEKSRESNGK